MYSAANSKTERGRRPGYWEYILRVHGVPRPVGCNLLPFPKAVVRRSINNARLAGCNKEQEKRGRSNLEHFARRETAAHKEYWILRTMVARNSSRKDNTRYRGFVIVPERRGKGVTIRNRYGEYQIRGCICERRFNLLCEVRRSGTAPKVASHTRYVFVSSSCVNTGWKFDWSRFYGDWIVWIICLLESFENNLYIIKELRIIVYIFLIM